MVPRRTHQAENAFALARELQSIQPRGHRGAGEFADAIEVRRIGVEVFQHVQAREHGRRVGAEDLFIADTAGGRRAPRQFQVRLLFEEFNAGGDALRPFGMAGLRITGAMFVGNDDHK